MWVLPLLIFLLIYTLSVSQSPELLLYGGIFSIGVGFITGIPIAIIYHYHLFRQVYPRDPKAITHFHWAVNPRRLHRNIPKKELSVLNTLFKFMIRCWYIAMGGCLLIVLWLFRLSFQ